MSFISYLPMPARLTQWLNRDCPWRCTWLDGWACAPLILIQRSYGWPEKKKSSPEIRPPSSRSSFRGGEAARGRFPIRCVGWKLARKWWPIADSLPSVPLRVGRYAAFRGGCCSLCCCCPFRWRGSRLRCCWHWQCFCCWCSPAIWRAGLTGKSIWRRRWLSAEKQKQMS